MCLLVQITEAFCALDNLEMPCATHLIRRASLEGLRGVIKLWVYGVLGVNPALLDVASPGSSGVSLESGVKRALERITAKLGALLLKQGKEREALNPCAESLVSGLAC